MDVLADRLETELAKGGCVLVVHNTVRGVLEAAAVLRERFGDANVAVAHSCFIDVDRAASADRRRSTIHRLGNTTNPLASSLRLTIETNAETKESQLSETAVLL
nr:hypothetical protein [Streptomyces sp. CoT10]